MDIENLKRIDDRPISDNRDEIRAFMVTWNDSLRLESTLKHYRQLGVGRFFVADCASTDGTLEALRAAPDVHTFAAAGGGGIDSINALLDAFGAGHWALTVDVGELFIYPHYEELELPLFCRFLSHVGAQAAPAVSLDMYAASPVADALHRSGSPLLNTCRYFDAGPYRIVQTEVWPNFEIHGGLRQRAFKSPPANPVLSRVPLVQWRAGMKYLRGTANLSPVKLAPILAALMRFEFLADFPDRAEGEAELCSGVSTNLYSDASTRFENSAQLVELGLMTTMPAYEESVRLTATARTAQSA